jgi:hypothetical protein
MTNKVLVIVAFAVLKELITLICDNRDSDKSSDPSHDSRLYSNCVFVGTYFATLFQREQKRPGELGLCRPVYLGPHVSLLGSCRPYLAQVACSRWSLLN